MNILTVRKKPVAVQAVKLERDRLQMPADWCGGKIQYGSDGKPIGVTVETLSGKVLALIGDYVMKGVKGEFYPCKSDIFTETYELIAW